MKSAITSIRISPTRAALRARQCRNIPTLDHAPVNDLTQIRARTRHNIQVWQQSKSAQSPASSLHNKRNHDAQNYELSGETRHHSVPRVPGASHLMCLRASLWRTPACPCHFPLQKQQVKQGPAIALRFLFFPARMCACRCTIQQANNRRTKPISVVTLQNSMTSALSKTCYVLCLRISTHEGPATGPPLSWDIGGQLGSRLLEYGITDSNGGQCFQEVRTQASVKSFHALRHRRNQIGQRWVSQSGPVIFSRLILVHLLVPCSTRHSKSSLRISGFVAHSYRKKLLAGEGCDRGIRPHNASIGRMSCKKSAAE